ncbi:spermatogenesis-associated protein 22 isoform X2 [Syngnathus scovelli]|uniref:spermatogenesis-associated protein 22 isoform X2 n=1 Tax=Syngnathus scovelli TaxID=161590 RepID=UPI00211054CA|nr:spermatogenesis-associated protein 22 isoform X2 [Syngnathus scovelli]
MKRNDNLTSRPTAGCPPMPLFNQKQRNPIPLTLTPSGNDLYSHNEFMPNDGSHQKKRNLIPLMTTPSANDCFSYTEFMTSTRSPAPYGASGAYGSYQALGSSHDAQPSHQWTKQDMARSTQALQHSNYRPAPTTRYYAPLPHPFKAEKKQPKMGTPSRFEGPQVYRSDLTSKQNQYQTSTSSLSAPSKQRAHSGFSQMGQQPPERPAGPTQFRSQPQPVGPLSGPAAQTQNKWNFKNTFGAQKPPFVGKMSGDKPQTPREPQTRSVPQKAAFDNSLRILNATIEGMKYWSQFKIKVPLFFEIIATLDSAVTIGHHGAKNFLLRNGNEVVQCVFYENEQNLPHLFRGQVHRCVGNYDGNRDVLVCMSIREAKPSEVRNALITIKVCDNYMRKLVKLFHEV